MKLQKILSRFLKLHKKEIDLSLDRIIHLCEKLGNPQDKIKAISIVGTNAISGLKLREKFRNIPNVSYKESIEDAIKSINLNQGDLLLITGSLYLCSEVLNLN